MPYQSQAARNTDGARGTASLREQDVGSGGGGGRCVGERESGEGRRWGKELRAQGWFDDKMSLLNVGSYLVAYPGFPHGGVRTFWGARVPRVKN